MLSDIDGAMVEQGPIVNFSGSAEQTRLMTFAFHCTCVHHNEKFSVRLCCPQKLHGVHYHVRGRIHVPQVAPRAHVHPRDHVRVDHVTGYSATSAVTQEESKSAA